MPSVINHNLKKIDKFDIKMTFRIRYIYMYSYETSIDL